MECFPFAITFDKTDIFSLDKGEVIWINLEKYAEIKYFSLLEEKKHTFLENNNFYYNKELSFYSDVVRYLLLYNYGGCWFDLDCFILRSFDPVFYNFESEICVYQWENQNYQRW